MLFAWPYVLVTLPAVIWEKFIRGDKRPDDGHSPSNRILVGALLGAFVGVLGGVSLLGAIVVAWGGISFGGIWLFVLPIITAAGGALKEWYFGAIDAVAPGSLSGGDPNSVHGADV